MTTPTHYLDFAATTPLRPVAREAWLKAQHDLTATPGNPSSLHAGGRAARRMLDDAREQIADLLGVNLHEVLFTSGATESDALAVAGTARAVRAVNPARSVVAVSALEHDAVAHQREVLEPAGFTWQVLPSSAQGIT
ncbi:MAG: aminotransferase class V-fold PLP-dependent enzyme, partial [Actinomyces sp.]|nr:aminotransferase class V-fold PLP-dependent enzyme [Actinomyces sp.]